MVLTANIGSRSAKRAATHRKGHEMTDKNEQLSELSDVWETLETAINCVVESITTFMRSFAAALKPFISAFIDFMSYAMCGNTKWWHYYRHSKKYRIRKKYRDRILREMIARFERRSK